MSPRGAPSSSTTAATQTRNSGLPYSRRSTSQPKSSRQQFSACGACRMRRSVSFRSLVISLSDSLVRVRCDLKDLPIGSLGPHPACSNCKERGIKCVLVSLHLLTPSLSSFRLWYISDEFADVKAVKLLRRGRRLQQAE